MARCLSRMPSAQSGPTVIVVDANVIATSLADDGSAGDLCRSRLRGERLTAPWLIDLEVASAFRRMRRVGNLDDRRAELALQDLVDLPLQRAPHTPLLNRCWELRHNLTVYDASYIALAEMLSTTLLTADSGIEQAPGVVCDIELIS